MEYFQKYKPSSPCILHVMYIIFILHFHYRFSFNVHLYIACLVSVQESAL